MFINNYGQAKEDIYRENKEINKHRKYEKANF